MGIEIEVLNSLVGKRVVAASGTFDPEHVYGADGIDGEDVTLTFEDGTMLHLTSVCVQGHAKLTVSFIAVQRRAGEKTS